MQQKSTEKFDEGNTISVGEGKEPALLGKKNYFFNQVRKREVKKEKGTNGQMDKWMDKEAKQREKLTNIIQ